MKSISAFIVATLIAVLGTLAALWLLITISHDPIVRSQHVFQTFLELLRPGNPDSLAARTGVTLIRVVSTSAISTVLGIVLGFVFCSNKYIWFCVEPPLDFLRSTPVTLLIGMASIFCFRMHTWFPVVLASLPCTLVMIMHVREALQEQRAEHRHVFQLISKKDNSIHTFVHFTVPNSVPQILTGLRVVISYAMVLIVVLEMLGTGGSSKGLGHLASDKIDDGVTSIAVAWFAGALGFGINKLLELFEKRVLRQNSSSVNML